MKLTVSLIICLLLFSFSYAQTVSTQGKEFYITFPKIDIAPENEERWRLQTIQLQVTSRVNTNGNILNSVSGSSYAFTVTAGTATIITIPRSWCMNDTSEVVIQRGIILTTEDTTSVYAMSVQNYTSDVSNILPTNTLGTDYIISSYASIYPVTGSIALSEFAIMATQDNTIISITPSAITAGGKPAGTAFTITLNKGQTYNVGSKEGDLTGSLVSVTNGCKPIAVFSGNDVGYIPTAYGTGDYLFEQLFPINTLGKNFIVTNMKSRNNSRVKIVAPYDNTVITINGSVAATINKGQYHEFEIDAPLSENVFHPGGWIWGAATDPSGNFYMTGNYSDNDGYNYISKWDGTTWTHLTASGAGGLNARGVLWMVTSDNAGNIYTLGQEGTTAGTFIGFVGKWNGTAWTRVGTFPDYDFPESITIDPSGNIYVGVNPWPSGTSYIAKWDGANWVQVGSGSASLNLNGKISSMTSDGAGNVYVAGNFTNTNSANYVAKWDGASWSELGNPAFLSGRLARIIKSDAAGNVYATINTNGSVGVAKCDGVSWSFLRNNSDIGEALAMDRLGNVYVWGPHYNVIRWNGTSWVELGQGARGLRGMASPIGSVDAIAAYDTSSVYAVGDIFSSAAWWNKDRWVEAAKFTMPAPVTYTISTSNPVQVMQYGTGKYYKYDTVPFIPGDPTMLTISPLEQTTTDVTFPLPDIGSIVDHYINITAKTADAANTFLDGVNIGASFTAVTTNPLYSIAQIDAKAGTHRLTNPGGFTACVYGVGWSQGYGYNIGASAPDTYFTVATNCSRQKKFNIHTSENIAAYIWNFGDGTPADTTNGTVTEKIHTYTLAGEYNVTLTTVKTTASVCAGTDTIMSSIKVNIAPVAKIQLEPAGANLCEQTPIKLNAGIGFSDYVWNTGERSAMININAFGNYSVTVNDAVGCQSADTISIVNNCFCDIEIPPVFTPNNDGYYDQWKINANNCFPKLNVSVYNRWGGLVYHSDNYLNDWNGLYQSRPLPDATYYYIIKAYYAEGRIHFLKGNVTIMR